MKLFVWDNPHPIKFGTSICFAAAETVEEAKKVLAASHMHGARWQSSEYFAEKLGNPTRVAELPCGEWHEWSE